MQFAKAAGANVETLRMTVVMQVFRILKQWLKDYYHVDFASDQELQGRLRGLIEAIENDVDASQWQGQVLAHQLVRQYHFGQSVCWWLCAGNG